MNKTKNVTKTTTARTETPVNYNPYAKNVTQANPHFKALFPKSKTSTKSLAKFSLTAKKNSVKGKLFTVLLNLRASKKLVTIESIEKSVYGLKKYATSMDNSSTYVRQILRAIVLKHPECFQVVSKGRSQHNKISVVNDLPISVIA